MSPRSAALVCAVVSHGLMASAKRVLQESIESNDPLLNGNVVTASLAAREAMYIRNAKGEKELTNHKESRTGPFKAGDRVVVHGLEGLQSKYNFKAAEVVLVSSLEGEVIVEFADPALRHEQQRLNVANLKLEPFKVGDKVVVEGLEGMQAKYNGKKAQVALISSIEGELMVHVMTKPGLDGLVDAESVRVKVTNLKRQADEPVDSTKPDAKHDSDKGFKTGDLAVMKGDLAYDKYDGQVVTVKVPPLPSSHPLASSHLVDPLVEVEFSDGTSGWPSQSKLFPVTSPIATTTSWQVFETSSKADKGFKKGDEVIVSGIGHDPIYGKYEGEKASVVFDSSNGFDVLVKFSNSGTAWHAPQSALTKVVGTTTAHTQADYSAYNSEDPSAPLNAGDVVKAIGLATWNLFGRYDNQKAMVVGPSDAPGKVKVKFQDGNELHLDKKNLVKLLKSASTGMPAKPKPSAVEKPAKPKPAAVVAVEYLEDPRAPIHSGDTVKTKSLSGIFSKYSNQKAVVVGPSHIDGRFKVQFDDGGHFHLEKKNMVKLLPITTTGEAVAKPPPIAITKPKPPTGIDLQGTSGPIYKGPRFDLSIGDIVKVTGLEKTAWKKLNNKKASVVGIKLDGVAVSIQVRFLNGVKLYIPPKRLELWKANVSSNAGPSWQAPTRPKPKPITSNAGPTWQAPTRPKPKPIPKSKFKRGDAVMLWNVDKPGSPYDLFARRLGQKAIVIKEMPQNAGRTAGHYEVVFPDGAKLLMPPAYLAPWKPGPTLPPKPDEGNNTPEDEEAWPDDELEEAWPDEELDDEVGIARS